MNRFNVLKLKKKIKQRILLTYLFIMSKLGKTVIVNLKICFFGSRLNIIVLMGNVFSSYSI